MQSTLVNLTVNKYISNVHSIFSFFHNTVTPSINNFTSFWDVRILVCTAADEDLDRLQGVVSDPHLPGEAPPECQAAQLGQVP